MANWDLQKFEFKPGTAKVRMWLLCDFGNVWMRAGTCLSEFAMVCILAGICRGTMTRRDKPPHFQMPPSRFLLKLEFAEIWMQSKNLRVTSRSELDNCECKSGKKENGEFEDLQKSEFRLTEIRQIKCLLTCLTLSETSFSTVSQTKNPPITPPFRSLSSHMTFVFQESESKSTEVLKWFRNLWMHLNIWKGYDASQESANIR